MSTSQKVNLILEPLFNVKDAGLSSLPDGHFRAWYIVYVQFLSWSKVIFCGIIFFVGVDELGSLIVSTCMCKRLLYYTSRDTFFPILRFILFAKYTFCNSLPDFSLKRE